MLQTLLTTLENDFNLLGLVGFMTSERWGFQPQRGKAIFSLVKTLWNKKV